MPNSKCAAAFCSNRRAEARKRKLDLIFHAFPADDVLRGKWIQFCERGEHWTPYKTDAVCSVHFKKHDYQMANSPRTWSNNLRRLNHDAIPSVIDGSLITISKKQKIDEQTRARLVEELYHKAEQNDVSTERDHTYSGVTAALQELEDTSVVLRMIVYRLQKFPNVCACCFRSIADEKLFTPFDRYHDELECTIEQKLAEITGVVLGEADHANLSHLLPDKVCMDCLEALVTFHQYQRQLQCMRKFCNGMGYLLRGNREPLSALYGEQRSYLVNLLQCLKVCKGPADKVTLERLEQEVATYGRVKKCTLFDHEHPPPEDTKLKDSEVIPPKQDDNKNGSKKWICPYEEICREWFLDEASLQQHVRDDHKVFKCRTCGTRIKFYDLFKKHIDSHEIARALLLSHNRKGTPGKELKCGNCGKAFQSADLLKRHRKTLCAAQNYECDTCLETYASENKFNKHTCSSSRMVVKPVDAAEEHDGKDFLGQDNSEFELENDSCKSSTKSTVLPNHSSTSLELSIEILR